jgi:hypothetical protein
MKSIKGLLLTSLLFSSMPLIAEEATLRCDAKQSFCTIENRRLIVGDDVAIVSEDDELVALGEVESMDGRTRKIQIKKKYGNITKNDRIRRVANQGEAEKSYKQIKAPGRLSIGGSLGLTPMNIASDAMAYSVEGIGEYLWKQGIYLVGRGHFFSASGTIDDAGQGEETESYSAQGLVAMGGVTYHLFAKNPVFIRPEVDLGLAYSSVSSGSSSLDKLGSGIGIAARLGVDAVYTGLGEWLPYATLGFEIINSARATTVGIGLMRDLKD